jgi:hypothetical protein
LRDGHERISPCDKNEPADNTLRSDTWLKQNVPLILNSAEYKRGGALFIIWDEAEDNGPYSDGPIGMFLLSPFAKGGGKRAYTSNVHYFGFKTVQEIFNVTPLLGGAGDADGRVATAGRFGERERKLVQQNKQRTHLTPTGLLMEGDHNQNPGQ